MENYRKNPQKNLKRKEIAACKVKGYRLRSKYLGGGITGRVFLAEVQEEVIPKNLRLKLLQKNNEKLKVNFSK